MIESRHLGLVTPDELTDLQERIEKLAEILEQTLDLDAILRLAEDASALSWEPLQQFLPEAYTTKSTLENNEIPQIRMRCQPGTKLFAFTMRMIWICCGSWERKSCIFLRCMTENFRKSYRDC